MSALNPRLKIVPAHTNPAAATFAVDQDSAVIRRQPLAARERIAAPRKRALMGVDRGSNIRGTDLAERNRDLASYHPMGRGVS